MTKQTPATARLMVQFPDNQVYCLSNDVLSNAISLNAFTARPSDRNSLDLITLRDLATSESFLLPRTCLSLYNVADEVLGHFIRRFEATGINAPYKIWPREISPFEIPLHGNVKNPKWAGINLGGSCNSHCTFCYTDWMRAVPDLETEQVKDLIDRIAAIGTVETFIFTGGEATLRSDLVTLFEYAKHAGFSKLVLQTNGRALKNVHLLKSLVDAGLEEVLFSLHGPNQEIHDAITGSAGSFVDALEGLHNLKRLSINPTINVVMCKQNYEHLTAIVDLVERVSKGHADLRFSYPIIEGAAFDNLENVLVSFSQLRPFMVEAIRLAEMKGYNVQLANFPLCIPDDNHRDTTYDTVTLSEFIQASPFYQFNIPRGEKSVKLNSCIACSKASLCCGIQVDYLRAYPDSIHEFEPIKR